MTARSSLYVGAVMHRRLRPRAHRFRYRAFWLLLDLDELDELGRKLRWFSHNRANMFSLFDRDHGDGGGASLRSQVMQKLRDAGIDPAGGSIQLLCMPRTLGYDFNPLSVYFCRGADGTPSALVYQVHNTFGERHSYVIPISGASREFRQSCRKALYVSPFLEMNMRYDFRIAGPDKRLAIGIRTGDREGPVLDAVLTAERMDLTNSNLMRLFFRIPGISLKVIGAIHWEALRLWLKGLRLQPRPAPPRDDATIVAATPTFSD